MSEQILIKKILTYAKSKGFDTKRILKAYKLAKKAHTGQKRKSGEAYIIHPVTVAYYLTKYSADETSIIAALLHDTVEDTKLTLSKIRKEFGKETAQVIDGLTKFSKNRFRDKKTLDGKIESLRKWLNITKKDVRTAIIKLADRLHNLETLGGHNNPEKEQKIAKETLDFFVKIADKLGISQLRDQIGELCVKNLDKNTYKLLKKLQKSEEKAGQRILTKIKRTLTASDKEKLIQEINARPPSILGMYQQDIHLKEEPKGALSLNLSITTKKTEDCYKILYLIHKAWKSEKGSVVDYINSPADNGYQGLHTRILFEKGRSILVRIKTKDMQQFNKYGITMLCFSGHSQKKTPAWLKNIPFINQETKEHSQAFWDHFQHEVLDQSIAVHTEKKDLLLLPSHSTALDASFYAHGRKAIYLKKVFINGISKPLSTLINENDFIQFRFSKAPQIEYIWLDYTETSLATSCIKKGLQKINQEQKVDFGLSLLNQELKQAGKGFIEEINEQSLDKILKENRVNDINELYQKIAEGKVSPKKVARKFYSQDKNIVSKKIIKLEGSFFELSQFLGTLPQQIVKELGYSLRSIKENVMLNIKTKNLSEHQWKFLLRAIQRNSKISHKIREHNRRPEKTVLIILVLSILWALDPIIAKLLLETSISPLALTTIRFSSVSLLIGLLITFQIFKSPSYSAKKFPIFNFKILLISFLLFGVALFTYNGLKETIASNYLLTLRSYAALFLIIALLKKHKGPPTKILIYTFVLAAGLVILLFNPAIDWPLTSKAWIIAGVSAFGIYALLSSKFQKKFKIFARYHYLQLLLSIYCTLFSLILLIFTSLPILNSNDVLLTIAFSCVFTGIPHLLYFQLMKIIKDTKKISFALSGSFFIALLVEMSIFKIFPSVLKIAAIVLIYTGLFSLFKLYKNQVAEE